MDISLDFINCSISGFLSTEINYHTLRSFMITNFDTKLKQPRKSHYKKDEEAFEAFKKTSRTSNLNYA